MKQRLPLVLSALALVVVLLAATPIGHSAVRSVVRVVGVVKVRESGARTVKVFDTTMPAGTRFTPSVNLTGFKTAHVAVYQTVGGSSSGAPVQTNYSCGGAPAGKLGVDIFFGNGREGGVTAGNNYLQINEPTNMSARADIYTAVVPVLRPTMSFDLCNHTTNAERVAVYVTAFRN